MKTCSSSLEKIMFKKVFKKISVIFLFSIFVLPIEILSEDFKSEENLQDESVKKSDNPVINKIIIMGNKYINNEVILNRIPYKENEKFDKSLTGQAIKNILQLGYFNQVKIKTEELDSNTINLYVKVEENKLIEKIEIQGNKAIKTKTIKEELNLDKLTTIDDEVLHRISIGIKKMYAKENYHKVEIKTEIIPNPQVPDKATALIIIKEGLPSRIARVYFKGNEHIPDRKLRTIIFTREDWLLNFIDEAGEFQEDALELDKHRIEYFYKDHGYLMATVVDAKVEFSKNERDIIITFYIKEGDLFTVGKLEAIGDEFFSEQELLHYVTLEENNPYSQTKLVESINNIKNLYGNKGYIYADVYPQIKPNEITNIVDITFYVEKGKKLYVNRINITGNKNTHDKVIRRQLDIAEGDLITSKKLSQSKSNVEYLSFFERGGVNWKMHRISEDKVDLEMNIKETKTGNLQAGLTYGSDKNTAQPSLRGTLTVEKKNLLGMGWDTGLMVQANRHQFKKVEFHFFDPSIFDTDVSGGLNFYRRWDEYDQWKNVNKTPKETVTGGNIRFGFQLPEIDKRLQLLLEFGVEDIENNNPIATGNYKEQLTPIVNRTFQRGTLFWTGIDLIKDTRNHQIYPSKGYKIILNTKIAPPFINQEYSFMKIEFDTSWYNALIGEDSLVLVLHGKAGTIYSLGDTDPKNKKKKIIPYKELFHMGGQNTVRGFVWGSIGPAWQTGDPLGGRHAIQFNAELVFPLIPDYSMKGHVFYDAGAGWDTPKYGDVNVNNIMRDKFNLRHSVGFGLNLLKPTPAKIDWGYKLDRNKKAGESPHEFHLSMNYAW
ncbi:outer membrane protein assembly factor BamA [Candidatus Dependentiae bacterium]|nr:outer membrane protein assembly factor BamA [Candidatus Dependentiae bacterium]